MHFVLRVFRFSLRSQSLAAGSESASRPRSDVLEFFQGHSSAMLGRPHRILPAQHVHDGDHMSMYACVCAVADTIKKVMIPRHSPTITLETLKKRVVTNCIVLMPRTERNDMHRNACSYYGQNREPSRPAWLSAAETLL